MSQGKLKIENEEYDFEIITNGIRIFNKTIDKFIPNNEIFSLRYISLFKIEFYSYIGISIASFGLWWLIGLILSLYTFGQYWANKRIVLLTNKGQIVLVFGSDLDKSIFVKNYKNTNPNAFKIKKWFQFRKEEK